MFAGVTRAALAALVLVGCAYREGSFNYTDHAFTGQRTTLGCVDLAVDRRNDAKGVAVIVYDFGNRCDRAVTIDLAYATVIGRTDAGDPVVLKPYDPNNEIRPLRLEGRSAGGETIAYESERHLAQVCIDLATVTHEGAAKVVCASANPPMQKTPNAPLTDGPAPQATDKDQPSLPSPADNVEPPNN